MAFDADKARKAALVGLSPSMVARFDLYVALLRKWQGTINLVSPSTLPDVWTRHVADSRQVREALPEARIWVDFGSGGGFPGLVTALLLAETPGAEVHLVESDKRKASFLRTVAREAGAKAHVHPERIEEFSRDFRGEVDAISARALAPLPQLVTYAEKFLDAGAVGVFLKGETAQAELTQLGAIHKFNIESIPSATDRLSRILIVRVAGAVPRCGGV